METTKEKIIEYLDQANATYEGFEHEPAGSAEEYHNTLGTRYEQQAKALFVRYKKTGEKGYIVVALQAQKRADLSVIKNLMQAKDVKLGHKDKLKEVTGCNFGELPPLGKLFGLKLFMDKDLAAEDKIYFNAGDLAYSIAIAPDEIVKLEAPEIF
jgi:Ala-tRNA(Pro) deacylase